MHGADGQRGHVSEPDHRAGRDARGLQRHRGSHRPQSAHPGPEDGQHAGAHLCGAQADP